jgi:hypothetical protein
MRRDNERVNRSCAEHSATTEFRLRCKKIAEVDAIWLMCALNEPSPEKVRAGPPSVLARPTGASTSSRVIAQEATDVCA